MHEFWRIAALPGARDIAPADRPGRRRQPGEPLRRCAGYLAARGLRRSGRPRPARTGSRGAAREPGPDPARRPPARHRRLRGLPAAQAGPGHAAHPGAAALAVARRRRRRASTGSRAAPTRIWSSRSTPTVLVATARALLRVRQAEDRLRELYERQREIALDAAGRAAAARAAGAAGGVRLAARYLAGARGDGGRRGLLRRLRGRRRRAGSLVIGDVCGRGAEAAAVTRARAPHDPRAGASASTRRRRDADRAARGDRRRARPEDRRASCTASCVRAATASVGLTAGARRAPPGADRRAPDGRGRGDRADGPAARAVRDDGTVERHGCRAGAAATRWCSTPTA